MVQDEAVWVVVHNDKVVAQGEIYQFFVRLAPGVGTRRHVGIVGPHDFHARQVHFFQGFEVRLPAVFGQQVIIGDSLAEDFAE